MKNILTAASWTIALFAVASACTVVHARDAAANATLTTPAASADAEALATLVAVNEHEIQTAKLALTRQLSPDVAQYANLMQKEHTRNLEKTRAVARAARMEIADTAAVLEMKSKAQAERAELEKLQGAVFEAAYIEAMVKGHGDVLIKLDAKFLPAVKNAVVASHLRETRGHVASHLTQAQKLDGNPQASL